MKNNGFYYQNAINQDIEKLIKEVEMYTWEQAENVLTDQAEIIETLLYSDEAMTIRNNSWGEKFGKMYELRMNLIKKQHMLYKMAHLMHVEWSKVFDK